MTWSLSEVRKKNEKDSYENIGMWLVEACVVILVIIDR
jgi:hypothetical protein